MYLIITIVVSIAIFMLLMKGVEKPPPTSTQQELHEEGMTPQQTRKELREQRCEQRDYARLANQSTRTANQIGRGFSTAIQKALKK